MKFAIYLSLFLIISCEKKQEILPVLIPKNMMKFEKLKANDINFSNPWFHFYQKENPNFQVEFFELNQTSSISYTESSIISLNEKGFDKVYEPFLIFNKSKNKYIDFDSSSWVSDDSEHIGFEVDQQIVLVDLETNQSKQFAFLGSSSWIEDAYWKGDSVAILLGNGYDKKPFMLKYMFNKKIVEHYKSVKSINTLNSYSIFRLKNKGMKMY